MNIEQLRNYCIAKGEAEESFPFGPDTLVFKTKGKMFLLVGLDSHPLQFNVKCDPENAIELREIYPQNILPGYHMNKKYWNTIIVDGILSTRQLQQFVDESYELIRKGKK